MKSALMFFVVVLLSLSVFAGDIEETIHLTYSAGFASYHFNGDYSILELTPAIGLEYEGIKDLPIGFLIGARVSNTAKEDDSQLFFRIETDLVLGLGLAYGFYFWRPGEFKKDSEGKLVYHKQAGIVNPFVSSRQFISLVKKL